MAHDCVHARVLGCDAASLRVRALMLTMTTILCAIPRNTVILEVTNQIAGRVHAHGFLRLRRHDRRTIRCEIGEREAGSGSESSSNATGVVGGGCGLIGDRQVVRLHASTLDDLGSARPIAVHKQRWRPHLPILRQGAPGRGRRRLSRCVPAADDDYNAGAAALALR